MTQAAQEVDRRSEALLSMAEVRKRTSLSTATVYRKMDAKTFPAKVVLGPNRVAWYQSEIERFIADPMGYRA